MTAGEVAARMMLDDPGRWEPEEMAEMLTRLFRRGVARL